MGSGRIKHGHLVSLSSPSWLIIKDDNDLTWLFVQKYHPVKLKIHGAFMCSGPHHFLSFTREDRKMVDVWVQANVPPPSLTPRFVSCFYVENVWCG